jgi:hypothetical protein
MLSKDNFAVNFITARDVDNCKGIKTVVDAHYQ